MEEYGDLERQYLLDFGFIASERDAIQWHQWEDEQRKMNLKEAKIVVVDKEQLLKDDRIKDKSTEVF